VAAGVLLLAAGCASWTAGPGERVPVSVSAANYSRLTDEQLFNELNAPMATPAQAPAVRRPPETHHYLLVPGEVYPNDAPMDDVYREVGAVLERRGYLDAEFEKRAGRPPVPVDTLLRVHYGRRLWLDPTVRPDRITWGNDGMVSNRYKTGLVRDWWERDPRQGLSPEDRVGSDRLMASLAGGFGMGSGGGKGADKSDALSREQFNMGVAGPMRDKMSAAHSSDYFVIVVEAFRLEDVDTMDRRAPCIWTVFIAVPADGAQKFSDVMRGMLQAATPYFGETTHGLQVYEVPTGRVSIGNPEVVR
jgi:hypothetical protein